MGRASKKSSSKKCQTWNRLRNLFSKNLQGFNMALIICGSLLFALGLERLPDTVPATLLIVIGLPMALRGVAQVAADLINKN